MRPPPVAGKRKHPGEIPRVAQRPRRNDAEVSALTTVQWGHLTEGASVVLQPVLGASGRGHQSRAPSSDQSLLSQVQARILEQYTRTIEVYPAAPWAEPLLHWLGKYHALVHPRRGQGIESGLSVRQRVQISAYLGQIAHAYTRSPDSDPDPPSSTESRQTQIEIELRLLQPRHSRATHDCDRWSSLLQPGDPSRKDGSVGDRLRRFFHLWATPDKEQPPVLPDGLAVCHLEITDHTLASTADPSRSSQSPSWPPFAHNGTCPRAATTRRRHRCEKVAGNHVIVTPWAAPTDTLEVKISSPSFSLALHSRENVGVRLQAATEHVSRVPSYTPPPPDQRHACLSKQRIELAVPLPDGAGTLAVHVSLLASDLISLEVDLTLDPVVCRDLPVQHFREMGEMTTRVMESCLRTFC
jgi:hypothetical protein